MYLLFRRNNQANKRLKIVWDRKPQHNRNACYDILLFTVAYSLKISLLHISSITDCFQLESRLFTDIQLHK